jgi:cyclopropane fatty-acyl-phospholipid synthase-like methyltransferase
MSFFNESYRGIPPWDIGRPQREFVNLSERGEVKGDIIDIGCGTGENAIFFASKGHRTLGVDAAPLAIEKAKAKARQRGSKAEFKVADALDLGSLKRQFDAATDCGLFHVFTDGERKDYRESLAAVLRPGGRYFMLVFSDKEPAEWGGPRRISKGEITDCFSEGWHVDFIRRAKFESTFHGEGGEAWISGITKLR